MMWINYWSSSSTQQAYLFHFVPNNLPITKITGIDPNSIWFLDCVTIQNLIVYLKFWVPGQNFQYPCHLETRTIWLTLSSHNIFSFVLVFCWDTRFINFIWASLNHILQSRSSVFNHHFSPLPARPPVAWSGGSQCVPLS